MSAGATDSKYPILGDLQIPEDILANWQITADLLAARAGVTRHIAAGHKSVPKLPESARVAIDS
jgi:hypothetical protein